MEHQDGALTFAAGTLLCCAYATGGSSQETNVGVMLTQLLSIPVLLFALWEAHKRGRLAASGWTLALPALVIALPLLQLVPLPESLWSLPVARQSLLQDLTRVGVGAVDHRWSLAPAATERDLLFLLPALALFFAAVALGSRAQRKILLLIVALTFGSLMLGFAQMAAGKDSILNLFPQWDPSMGGVFANANHQAASVAIGLVLAIALAFDTRSRIRRGEKLSFLLGLLAIVITIFVAAVPMIGSRAGPIIAIVPVTLFMLFSGVIAFDHRRPLTQAATCIALLILCVTMYAAFSWAAGSKIDSIRSALAQQTALIGFTHAPWGGGLGAFVPLFEQGADPSVLRDEFFNAAHNDYAQLWLEAGPLAIICLLALMTWLGVSARRLFAMRHKSNSRKRGMAALAALIVILLHSWVDYPLRAPGLMAVFAVVAAMLATASVRGRSKSDSSSHGDNDDPDNFHRRDETSVRRN